MRHSHILWISPCTVKEDKTGVGGGGRNTPWALHCRKPSIFMGRYKALPGFPDSSAGKESTYKAGDPSSIPGSIPQRRDKLPTPVFMDLPGGSDGKEFACNAKDLGSIPELGRSPGGGRGNPL